MHSQPQLEYVVGGAREELLRLQPPAAGHDTLERPHLSLHRRAGSAPPFPLMSRAGDPVALRSIPTPLCLL